MEGSLLESLLFDASLEAVGIEDDKTGFVEEAGVYQDVEGVVEDACSKSIDGGSSTLESSPFDLELVLWPFR